MNMWSTTVTKQLHGVFINSQHCPDPSHAFSHNSSQQLRFLKECWFVPILQRVEWRPGNVSPAGTPRHSYDFHSSPSDWEAPICKRWGNWKMWPCLFMTLRDNDNVLTKGQRTRTRKVTEPHQPQFLRGPTQQWRHCHLCPIPRNVQEGRADWPPARFWGSPWEGTRA